MRTKVNVSNEVFLAKYLEYQNKGLSFTDLSEELHLAPLSLYQRMNKLSKELSAKGVEIPKMPMKTGRKGKTNIDTLVGIVNSYTKNTVNSNVEQNNKAVDSVVVVGKNSSTEMEYVDV